MNEKQYVYYGKGRKKKKIIITVCSVLGAVLVALGAIGIIAGSNSPERQAVSSAINENMELKQKVSDMQTEIDELKNKISELEGELGSRPTFSPSPSESLTESSPLPETNEGIAPRERVQN